MVTLGKLFANYFAIKRLKADIRNLNEIVMNYWLMKTEPETFGYENLQKDGKTTWDGVRNYAARNYMKTMKNGDTVFIYHSVSGKAIVGTAFVSKEAFQDPTTEDEAWVAVELIPDKPLKRFVTLAEVKAHPELKKMFLATHSRLSVSPVTPEEYNIILQLAEKS